MPLPVRFLLPGLLAGTTLLLTNCSKSKDPEPPAAPTRVDLLTGHNWRLTASSYAITENGATNTRDTYATLLPCGRDNFVKFNRDYSYTHDNGPTKCDPADLQILISSTWGLSANDTQLVFVPGSATALVYQIKTLDATTLSIERVVTTQAKTENYTYTYVAI